MFDSVKRSFEFINTNGFLTDDIAGVVQETINNNDKDTAMRLIKDYNLALA